MDDLKILLSQEISTINGQIKEGKELSKDQIVTLLLSSLLEEGGHE